MYKNPEINLMPNDELSQLHHVNTAGAQLFDFQLFPRKYKHPEYLFKPHMIQPVQDFFPTVLQGLTYTTRIDDPNYPAYLHDGKYVSDALRQQQDRKSAVEDIEQFLDEAFGLAEKTQFEKDPLEEAKGQNQKPSSEIDALIASLDMEVAEEYDDGFGPVGSTDPNLTDDNQITVEHLHKEILPSTHHALITLGILNRLPPDQLPYADAFPLVARNMWGQNLTVDRVRIIIEKMEQSTRASLRGGLVTNYDLVPVAQFFDIGSRLTTGIYRQIVFKEPYKPY